MRWYHLTGPLLGLILNREFFTILPPQWSVQVVRVLDGDTLELAGEERLRLAGIDAPEKGQPTRLGNQDAGKWATRCLAQKIHQHPWRLVTQGRDIYGRRLGDLVFGRVSLSLELVEAGCASVYPLTMNRALWRARERAQRARRGLWSLGGFERPQAYRRRLRKRI